MRATICRGWASPGVRCPNPTREPSGYCPAHGSGFGARFRRTPSNPVYATARWRRLRRRVVEAWVAEHGWICPGWRTPFHPSQDLTVDHVVPLVQGAAAFDERNLSVLCRRCNSRKSLKDRQAPRGRPPSRPPQ